MSGNVYGQYASRIVGSILFHSVPYEQKDKSTLEWWEYDKLGTKASLGCVRLTVEDAKWIYNNCVSGTKVEFYSSSNPGPLGKPKAQKISEDNQVRNWDPTDPDGNNPWKTYTKPTTTKPVTGNQAGNNSNTQENSTNSNIVNNQTQGNTSNNITNNNMVEDKTDIKNTTDEKTKVDTELIL